MIFFATVLREPNNTLKLFQTKNIFAWTVIFLLQLANLERERKDGKEAAVSGAAVTAVSPREKEGFGRGGNGIFGTPKSNEVRQHMRIEKSCLRVSVVRLWKENAPMINANYF